MSFNLSRLNADALTEGLRAAVVLGCAAALAFAGLAAHA
jgi:hypothetical protein